MPPPASEESAIIRPARVRPAFLPAGARAREARHQRLLLLGLAGLLLLSLTPVVGRHVFGTAHAPLTGIDHLGPLCLVALHELLAPVHAALHLLVAAGLSYALWDRARAWARAHRALGALHGVIPMHRDVFWLAAERAGVPPDRLRVVDGLPTPAFTAGWRRPLVYAARELADGPRHLAPEELAAVLAHEGAHVARRDPLRFSVLRLVARTLFWLPALRGVVDDVMDEAEIRADDVAAARTDPLTLASALVALGGWGLPVAGVSGGLSAAYAVGFVRPDLLERRVRRLAGEDTAPASRVTHRALGGAALALAVVWVSGIVDVHALPMTAAQHVVDARHCDHPHESPWAHLFCRWGARGGWITYGGIDCPHQAGRRRS